MSKCPACGAEDTRKAMLARTQGFDPGKHCTIVANQKGILTPVKCVENRYLCECCPIGKAMGFAWKLPKILKEKGKV